MHYTPKDSALEKIQAVKSAKVRQPLLDPVKNKPQNESSQKPLSADPLQPYSRNSALKKGNRLDPFDVIVVGAGPAGLTAAYFLAQAGLQVIVIERGPRAGSKVVSGASIYADMISPLFPQFLESNCWEGLIKSQEYWLLTHDASIVSGYHKAPWGELPISRMAVNRSSFDPWLAGQSQEAGAVFLYSTLVQGLLWQGRQVVGVRTDHQEAREIYGRVVLLAEGAYPSVALSEGLVPPLTTKNVSLYIKETFELPPVTLQERFRIKAGESVVIGLFGYSTNYQLGTASLYTYKNGFSMNVGTTIDTLKKGGLHPNMFLKQLKEHPVLRPLLEGSRTGEYGAHLIPDGGYNGVPSRLVHDGLLLLGDTAGLVNGIQGINLAMFSGHYAALAVVDACNKGDLSQWGLAGYENRLKDSFVMKNLKANRRVPGFYSRHPDLCQTYVPLLERLASHIGRTYPLSRDQKRQLLYKEVKQSLPLPKIFYDLYDILRTVR